MLLTINPIAFSIGSLDVHWYGIMYIFGFICAWILGCYRTKNPCTLWTKHDVEDLITWVMVGVIIGGRIGYSLFYEFSTFLNDPLEIFRLWNGGMSFHGGLLGVLLSIYLWSKKQKRHFLVVVDFIALIIPPGLFLGRLGNFINGELWGSITNKPWGVIFPNAGPFPRHPSQIYEALLEGVLLFICLWVYAKKPKPEGHIAGLFGILYGLFRFSIEFIRQPDSHIGYLAFGWLTMGQVLSIPLIIVGLWLFLRPAPLNQS